MNLFELFVKIGVDDQASNKLKDLSGKLGTGLKTAAKIGTAAVGAAATGITALTTAAVNNYAEYEQLVGGVDTLFKSSSQKVQEYVANAYKTAGVSANEYMSTVTSFSASLLQGLNGDTEKAAEYANRALTDMADNANKMGTSMEMIQNAYQGFAKQNFTMLDNLKLGYGGTKSEMDRLIEDASKMTDVQKELGITVSNETNSFDNIVNAISVMQYKMGIAGTTAYEAGRTISGSVGSMKSAWTNLVTGLADGNSDIETLVENLVTTIVGDGTESNLGFLGNIVPAIETALNGAATLLENVVPELVQKIPGIIEGILPNILSAIVSVLSSVVNALPSLLSVITDTLLPDLLGKATETIESIISILPSLIDTIASSLSKLLPIVISAASSLIVMLASALPDIIKPIVENLPTILEAISSAFSENLPLILDAVIKLATELIKFYPDIAKTLISAIPDLYGAVFGSLIDALPTLLDSVGTLILELFKVLPSILLALLITSNPLGLFFLAVYGILKHLIGEDLGEKILEFLGDAWENVSQFFSDVFGFVKDFVSKLIQAYVDAFGKMIAFYKELPGKIWNFLLDIISFVFDFRQKIIQAVLGIIKNIVSSAIENVKKFKEIGGQIVSGMKEGIKSAWSNLKNWFKNLFGDLIGIAKKILGIASPSKVFKKLGSFTADGFGIGFEDEFAHVKDDMEDALNFDDASVGINASIRKVGAGAAGGAFGGTSIGNITINIDGAKYSDEQSLASAIALEIQNMTDRRAAVYA